MEVSLLARARTVFYDEDRNEIHSCVAARRTLPARLERQVKNVSLSGQQQEKKEKEKEREEEDDHDDNEKEKEGKKCKLCMRSRVSGEEEEGMSLVRGV